MEEDKDIKSNSVPVATTATRGDTGAGKEEKPANDTSVDTTATNIEMTVKTTEEAEKAPATSLEGTAASTGDENTDAPSEGNERKAWDFSHRKVMIKNIMKFLNKRDIKKMIARWTAATDNKVRILKHKKPPKDPWILVTVEKEEQVAILVDYINNNVTNKKGEKLHAHSIEPNMGVREGDDNDDDDDDDEDSDRRNRKRGNRDDEKPNTKRQRVQRAVENAKPRIITNEEVKNAMIPLWKSTYEEQLRAKEKEMVKRSALKIVKEIKEKFRYVMSCLVCCCPILGQVLL